MMPGKRTSLIFIAMGLATVVGCGSSSPSSSSTTQPFQNQHLAFVALPTTNSVAAYKVDNNSAIFTNILGSPYPGGTSPSAVLVHPSNRFVYAANQIGNNISLFTVNSTLGSLLEVLPRTPAGLTPAALAMDSGGTLLFALNRVSSSISVYSINSGNGALTPVSGSPFPTFSNPFAFALAPSGKFLYVLNSDVAAVFAYTVTSGVLKAVTGLPVQVGNGPLAIAVDPAETFVYVANSVDNTVSVLSINSSTGGLTLLGTYATATTPTAVVALGQYLYVANLGSSNISVFAVTPVTGVLTQITSSPFTAGSAPLFEVIDPNGKFLYIGSQTAKTISALSINATTGAVTETGETTTTEFPPVSMSVAQ
ncbi:MAG TPA: beta-propeller fold lactonase family protein [Gemmata sp.]|nr:beta-propeller fold lactonase family protein [Gemmata sp.]